VSELPITTPATATRLLLTPTLYSSGFQVTLLPSRLRPASLAGRAVGSSSLSSLGCVTLFDPRGLVSEMRSCGRRR
jgi:hypothetical protein